MAVILTDLINIVTATYGNFMFVVGSKDGLVYVERFRVVTGVNVNWEDGTERKQVCVGTYAGFEIYDGKLVVTVVGVGTYVSYDCGEIWVDRTDG